MATEDILADQVEQERLAAIERYHKILKPSPWNTVKLFIVGVIKAGRVGPAGPGEMRNVAKAELERIQKSPSA